MAQPGLRVGVPVICVGNFVAGGAGKTPAAIAIAHLLHEMGERVAFLSRGYGGARRAGAVAVDLNIHSAGEVGDEPLLLAQAAPCFVARDRRVAAHAAIEAGASVLVLDDGLQNPALAKDFSFALIDGGVGFGNGLCLPAGPLRAAPMAQLPFVSAVVFVDGVSDASSAAHEAVSGKIVLNAHLEPDPVVAANLRNQNVLAFHAAINAARTNSSPPSKALGARVVAAARGFLADHQRYFLPAQAERTLFAEAAEPRAFDAGDDAEGFRAHVAGRCGEGRGFAGGVALRRNKRCGRPAGRGFGEAEGGALNGQCFCKRT